jgi:hypothetical protein
VTFNVPAGTEAGVAVVREDATPGEMLRAAETMRALALRRIMEGVNAVLSNRDGLHDHIHDGYCQVGVEPVDPSEPHGDQQVVLRIEDEDAGDYAGEAAACEGVLREMGVDVVRWPQMDDEFWVPVDPTKPGTLR